VGISLSASRVPGLSFTRNPATGWYCVNRVSPGSPADASKIECSDELISADGVSLNPKTGPHPYEELQSLLYGPLGSRLILSLRKPAHRGSKVYVVNLVRSSLDTHQTVKALFPSGGRAAFQAPVALRIVLDGNMVYAVAKMRKLLCQLMRGTQEKALATWKHHLVVSCQVPEHLSYTDYAASRIHDQASLSAVPACICGLHFNHVHCYFG